MDNMDIREEIKRLKNSCELYQLWEILVRDRICYKTQVYIPRLTNGIDQAIMLSALHRVTKGVS